MAADLLKKQFVNKKRIPAYFQHASFVRSEKDEGFTAKGNFFKL